MSPTENAVLLRAFGNLEGTVASMATQWRQQEENASKSRKELYERFERMSVQLGNIQAGQNALAQDVAEIKNDIDTQIMPTVDAYKTGVARSGGIAFVGKLFWAGIVGLATLMGVALHQVLVYFGWK